MKQLAKLARSAAASTGVQFRDKAYGGTGTREFLRDVMAMANASVSGTRYIITGATIGKDGDKQFCKIDSGDFAGKPSYQSLANEFIEPPVRIKYQPVSVDGVRLGVYEIADCQDRPYMMRIDHSETLRRGDAYQRVKTAAVKLGRRQLQSMFEDKFRESVSAAHIEIGFPGEIIHKDFRVPLCDLSKLPSSVETSKLNELLELKSGKQHQSAASGSTAMVARLTHARLFGSDSPYEDKSEEELLEDMQQIQRQYRLHDEHFLFEDRAEEIQLVVYNQGEEVIRDASLAIVLPNRPNFHVAKALPMIPRDDKFVERSVSEQSGYPSVTIAEKAVQISAKLGDIEPGEFKDAFELPLRLCVGESLQGKRFAMQYSLFAQNLRTPAKGKLRLLF